VGNGDIIAHLFFLNRTQHAREQRQTCIGRKAAASDFRTRNLAITSPMRYRYTYFNSNWNISQYSTGQISYGLLL